MKKKHKSKLLKLILSLILMLVVTIVGYFQSNIEENYNGQILAKPRNRRSIIYYRWRGCNRTRTVF